MIMPTLHRSVIIGRNPIEANANTGAIQLLGNPSAPPGNPLAIIGKLPTISKSTIQDFQVGADGFPGNW